MREFGGFVGWLQRKKEGRWLSWSIGCWLKKEGRDHGGPAHVSPRRPVCCAGPSTPSLDRVSLGPVCGPVIPWTPRYPPGLLHTHTSSTRAAVGEAARPLSGAAPQSVPFPETQVPKELRPQLTLSQACNKSPLPFIWVYFVECVAPVQEVETV